MIVSKKNFYNNLIKRKKVLNLYTHNSINSYDKFNNLKEKQEYIIYLLIQDQNQTKFYVKEFPGILIKKRNKNNLTKLHFICLKKYNNIYFSFFKELPNIYFNKI